MVATRTEFLTCDERANLDLSLDSNFSVSDAETSL